MNLFQSIFLILRRAKSCKEENERIFKGHLRKSNQLWRRPFWWNIWIVLCCSVARISRAIESGHSKTCQTTCAYSEDTDQPVHLHNLASAFTVGKKTVLGPRLHKERQAKTNETAQMRRLIWVIARRTWQFVSFAVPRLNFLLCKIALSA